MKSLDSSGAEWFEVELKFPLAAGTRMAEKLQSIGARFAGKAWQDDLYFQHPQRDFRQTDEALRLRRDGDETCVTYKGPKVDGISKTRHEIEISLGSPEDLASFAALFAALGFIESAHVHKSRHRFHLERKGRAIEIALDEVEGLGQYLELECKAARAQIAATRGVLVELAGELGLTASEQRSYLELLAEKARS